MDLPFLAMDGVCQAQSHQRHKYNSPSSPLVLSFLVQDEAKVLLTKGMLDSDNWSTQRRMNIKELDAVKTKLG